MTFETSKGMEGDLVLWTFQSSFSEYDLWNTVISCDAVVSGTFNPHFLSMTFETESEKETTGREYFLSILIFWVWPLKPTYLKSSGLHWCTFNPHFLSMTFETMATMVEPLVFSSFQSSFSEYDLWNLSRARKGRFSGWLSILIFWVWPLKLVYLPIGSMQWMAFNPHFLSMTFETLSTLL